MGTAYQLSGSTASSEPYMLRRTARVHPPTEMVIKAWRSLVGTGRSISHTDGIHERIDAANAAKLLGTHRHWPSQRATGQSDELPPLHSSPLAAEQMPRDNKLASHKNGLPVRVMKGHAGDCADASEAPKKADEIPVPPTSPALLKCPAHEVLARARLLFPVEGLSGLSRNPAPRTEILLGYRCVWRGLRWESRRFVGTCGISAFHHRRRHSAWDFVLPLEVGQEHQIA